MTKAEKKLMALTLTHMIEYGLTCKVKGEGEELMIKALEPDQKRIFNVALSNGEKVPMNDVVPILVPMTAITKDEAYELHDLGGIIKYDSDSGEWQTMPIFTNTKVLDWFETHLIDYRGLIEKKLAIPKENKS